MPKFKVYDTARSGYAKVARAKQTRYNQVRAAKENRPSKAIRRMIKRSRRFFPFDYAFNPRTGKRRLVWRA